MSPEEKHDPTGLNSRFYCGPGGFRGNRRDDRSRQFRGSNRGSNNARLIKSIIEFVLAADARPMPSRSMVKLGPFYWYGGRPGEKRPALGEKVARHTKRNPMLKKAERPGHRVIAKHQFTRLNTMDDVIERLTGL